MRTANGNVRGVVFGALSLVLPVSYAPALESPALGLSTASYGASPFETNVVDANGDGWLEPFGMLNAGDGVLTAAISAVDADSLGLGKLFDSQGRSLFKTVRVVDLNGDGLPDILADTYTCPGDPQAPAALLFLANADGTYTEDPSFTALQIGGHGESIVVADFDNDGWLDIYIPRYTSDYPGHGPCAGSFGPSTPASKAVLLRNLGPFSATDGREHFRDVTTPAVDLTDLRDNASVTPEGAQAVDINDDGLVDLYVAGHMLINTGNMTFVNRSFEYGLPWCAVTTSSGDPDCTVPGSSPPQSATAKDLIVFDEGLKFLDWNNDGLLDLLWLHPTNGLHLYQQSRVDCDDGDLPGQGSCAVRFQDASAAIGVGTGSACDRDGLNVQDVDNDGREDILVGGGQCDHAMLLQNLPTGFLPSAAFGNLGLGNAGGAAFGDINGDGKPELIFPGGMGGPTTVVTASSADPGLWFVIEILGAHGEKNQQGRVVRIAPPSAATAGSQPSWCPGGAPTCYTRVVDGGSGYLGMNQYALLVGTSNPGAHHASVVLPVSGSAGTNATVAFGILPGQYARVYAPGPDMPNGHVLVCTLPPTGWAGPWDETASAILPGTNWSDSASAPTCMRPGALQPPQTPSPPGGDPGANAGSSPGGDSSAGAPQPPQTPSPGGSDGAANAGSPPGAGSSAGAPQPLQGPVSAAGDGVGNTGPSAGGGSGMAASTLILLALTSLGRRKSRPAITQLGKT